jgi:NAD(P)-dependent dehydrogenase (short-subunit alcohol dehydrogenase family)
VAEAGHWLAGRLAVVTGASRGIGAATAEAIAAAGARVVLAARDREALDGVVTRVRDAGGEATAVATDVSIATDVERLFDAVQAAGPLAALVCAAAVLTPARFTEATAKIWEEMLGVNLTGTFLCCRAAFAAMRAGGGGRIVNIASLSGVYATENRGRRGGPSGRSSLRCLARRSASPDYPRKRRHLHRSRTSRVVMADHCRLPLRVRPGLARRVVWRESRPLRRRGQVSCVNSRLARGGPFSGKGRLFTSARR